MADSIDTELITEAQLNKAVQIVSWDIAKQGKIHAWACSVHGRSKLLYLVTPKSVQVKCDLCDENNIFVL